MFTISPDCSIGEIRVSSVIEIYTFTHNSTPQRVYSGLRTLRTNPNSAESYTIFLLISQTKCEIGNNKSLGLAGQNSNDSNSNSLKCSTLVVIRLLLLPISPK